jgi:hypothetical protein
MLARDRVQDLVGDTVDVALLQTHIPLRAYPSEHGDLFAA